jgi:hypothetical protein
MPPTDSMEKPPTVERTAGPIMVFSNSYARLPERFFVRLAPTPAARPRLIEFNAYLSQAHPDIVALVDGDVAGRGYSAALVQGQSCVAVLLYDSSAGDRPSPPTSAEDSSNLRRVGRLSSPGLPFVRKSERNCSAAGIRCSD